MSFEVVESLLSTVFEPVEHWFGMEVVGEIIWATFEFDTLEGLLEFLKHSRLDIISVIILGIAGGGYLLVVKIRNKEPTLN